MRYQNEKETFNYTYSAKRQKEIQEIRKKYLGETTEEDKIERLRRLDKSVTDKSTVVSLIFGFLGTLILGIGMSCVLVWGGVWIIIGIIIGLIGIFVLSLAYPVYNYITKKEREKVAPEILRLTEELMNE